MPSITSANAVFTLAIASLFPTPQTLEGFSAEDIFSTDPLASAQTLMGVDGHLSGGFVYVPVSQSIALQADSASNSIFEQWHQASRIAKDVYIAQGIIILPSVNKKWALRRGFLTAFPPIPNAAKVLQPRRYGVTWQEVQPQPV